MHRRDGTEANRTTPEQGSSSNSRSRSIKNTSKGKKIFISYRRRATRDAELARFLHSELERAGHQVFIDTEVDVGVDWSAEITSRIEWCEFLIVLLSEEAIESEMVQEEVRLAHHRRKRDGTPAILPVRLCYDGELNYAFGAYISRLQHVSWTKPEDHTIVLARLLKAIGSRKLQDLPSIIDKVPASTRPKTNADTIHMQPSTVADPRVLRRRPNKLALYDACYLEREADLIVLPLAEDTGETIVIKAPFKMGKTSLLIRYLNRCRENGKKIAFLDFQIFSKADLKDVSVILTKIACLLLREFDLDPILKRSICSPLDLTEFIEDEVFKNFREPITIAFDGVDLLMEYSYGKNLFAMLRGWHNRRASHFYRGWDRLDLALVVASEPSMLIQDAEQSPFNVVDPIRLESFFRPQLIQLNTVFDHPLHDGELDILHQLTGGQPYLTRLAFYLLGPAVAMPFDKLLRHAIDGDGPFGEHLRAKLSHLERRRDLSLAMARLVRNAIAPDENTYYRLNAAGLARRENGQVVPTNLLYARFFDRVLQP